jgi:hypothetical protein
VLGLLVLGVAFIGVLSASMALQMEPLRKRALLGAAGLTVRELTRLMLSQTSLLGLAAGAFATPLGVLFGDLMTQLVNLSSVCRTMELKVPIGALLSGLVLDWTGALLAGLYPGDPRRPGLPAEALRAERVATALARDESRSRHDQRPSERDQPDRISEKVAPKVTGQWPNEGKHVYSIQQDREDRHSSPPDLKDPLPQSGSAKPKRR